MAKRGSVFLLCAVAALAATSGGAAADEDIQFWGHVNSRYRLDETWSLGLNTRVRVADDVSDVKDVLLRPFVCARVYDRTHVMLGYDRLQAIDSGGRDENRVWQAISHTLPVWKIRWQNRLRLDERWLSDVSGTLFRLRYRARFELPLEGTPWSLTAWNQTWFNLNDRGSGPPEGFEQNRLGVGTWYRLGGGLRVGTAFQWIHKRRRSGEDGDDLVFMVNFHWAGGR